MSNCIDVYLDNKIKILLNMINVTYITNQTNHKSQYLNPPVYLKIVVIKTSNV
jgi:hypothetical protein